MCQHQNMYAQQKYFHLLWHIFLLYYCFVAILRCCSTVSFDFIDKHQSRFTIAWWIKKENIANEWIKKNTQKKEWWNDERKRKRITILRHWKWIGWLFACSMYKTYNAHSQFIQKLVRVLKTVYIYCMEYNFIYI